MGYDNYLTKRTLGPWINSSEHRQEPAAAQRHTRIGIASAKDASGKRTLLGDGNRRSTTKPPALRRASKGEKVLGGREGQAGIPQAVIQQVPHQSAGALSLVNARSARTL